MSTSELVRAILGGCGLLAAGVGLVALVRSTRAARAPSGTTLPAATTCIVCHLTHLDRGSADNGTRRIDNRGEVLCDEHANTDMGLFSASLYAPRPKRKPRELVVVNRDDQADTV